MDEVRVVFKQAKDAIFLFPKGVGLIAVAVAAVVFFVSR